jgi:membrane protein
VSSWIRWGVAGVIFLVKDLRQMLYKTAVGWLDHEGPRLAASLSLYSLLSLAPLIILCISITSFAFGRGAAQEAVVSEVRRMMGDSGASAVQTVIQYGKTPQQGHIASIIGLLTLLFGASSVFGELQSALNKIWNAKPSDKTGVLSLIRSRLFSFAMVFSLGFLLLVSLVFSAAVTVVSSYFSTHLSAPTILVAAVSELFSVAAIAGLIAMIFKYVPDVPMSWRDVWEGAVATALLFTAGKWLLGLYLGTEAVGSAYGAAGSLVVVIVWVYYSAMIFYFGAEFTRVRAEGRGGGGSGSAAQKTGRSASVS